MYESRPYMDRNNVLKLWSFVMEDLKSLGAKKFCPNLGKQEIRAITFKNTKKKTKNLLVHSRFKLNVLLNLQYERRSETDGFLNMC